MTLSGQEIQRNLAAFAKRWGSYAGGERAEAQTFLNELFDCYGTDRRTAGIEFEENQHRPGGTRGFLDAWWPPHCLVEMKRPSEASRLAAHREQALEYWRHSADPSTDRPAVEYVVLCAFNAFEVWQPGRFPLDPRAVFTLDELPDRYEALQFLAGQRPLFRDTSRKLTTEAAKCIVRLYETLINRGANDPVALQSFVLQTVWSLFASSLGMLAGRPVQWIVNSLLHDASGMRSSAAEVGHLFTLLADDDLRGRGGIYAQAPYANGGLFDKASRVHLEREELELLAEVAAYDWSEVEPTIFGSLLEGFLPRDRAITNGSARTQFGIHYTHESDIMKIVVPTIVEPWTERIEAAQTVEGTVAALRDLCRFRVLDPACGSGNFLFVAYLELRRLEEQARQHIAQLATRTGVNAPDLSTLPQYPLTNLYGIEYDPFAVQVSRLVLWMGHKLAADRHGTAEPPLPLPDLSETIVKGDALELDWPEVEAIIGNPPFNGSQHLRQALGDRYVAGLQRMFNCGVQDYCTYWFRKAADHLPPTGRAGLVGTNSVAQGRGREAALDYVVEREGVITDAVSSQKWPGEAKVHVSIVNWVNEPPTQPERFVLDGVEVPGGIAPDLVPAPLSTITARPLDANKGVCFQGPIPVGDGFVLDKAEAAALLARREADYAQIVRPYLVGDDITEDSLQRPRRWIIDFGVMPLEEAARFPEALAIVRERVKPKRDTNRREFYRRYWWRLGEPRPGMRTALAGLDRFLSVGATGKRTLFAWCEPAWCPSNLVYAVALDDDYAFGVLSSGPHALWAVQRGSTLETRARYTNTTVFETFPWPQPERTGRERIAAAARGIVEERARACDGVRGLTEVYNTMDDGGFTALASAHQELDAAVAAAYGWAAKIVEDPYEVIPRFMERNADIAAGRHPYRPFPGRDAAMEDEPRFDLR
ncbi:MAG: DNA methyltransferase [Egibacteraceae bacterium]